MREKTARVICDSPENSVTDIDQRICPTVMQMCANVPFEECEDALRCRVPNSSLLALSATRVPDQIWKQKGSLNTATIRREHQNRLSADSMLDLAQTQLPSIAPTLLCLEVEKEMKIVVAILDDAGKTTTLYRVKLDTAVTTIPTIGFNVESLEHRSLELPVWGIGGQEDWY